MLFNATDSSLLDNSVTILPIDDWHSYVPVIIIVLCSCFYLPSLALFWWNRSSHPIRGRDGSGCIVKNSSDNDCILTLSVGASLYILSLGTMVTILLFPDTDSCIFRLVFLWLGVGLAVIANTCRVILILFNFEIQHQIQLTSNQSRSTSNLLTKNLFHSIDINNLEADSDNRYRSSNLFVRYRSYFTKNKIIVTFFLLWLLVQLAVWIPTVITDARYHVINSHSFEMACDPNSPIVNVFIFLMATLVLVNLIIGVRISRYAADAWMIKRELLEQAILLIVTEVLEQFTSSMFSSFYYTDYITVTAAAIGFTSTILKPLYSVYKKKVKSTRVLSADFQSLEELLALENGFEVFLQFTQAEFSSENLLFYTDVTKFKQNINNHIKFNTLNGESVRLVLNEILTIYSKYCSNSSAMQINLPHHIQSDIQTKINVILAKKNGAISAGNHEMVRSLLGFSMQEVYDPSYDCVFDLMVNDSFVRFLFSPLAKQFRKQSAKKTIRLS
jgi:hypothetical protein